MGRRLLWHNLMEFGSWCLGPWLLLGDFNNVLRLEKKYNNLDVLAYQIQDFYVYCATVGLSDLPLVGCFFTWSNNSVMSKLDWVMANNPWVMEGLFSQANFLPLGCLSDHSSSIVSIIHLKGLRRKSFKFYNMWDNHKDFCSLIGADWQQHVEGTTQYSLCIKLKHLKILLRKLNDAGQQAMEK